MIIREICKKALLLLTLVTACCNSSKNSIPDTQISPSVEPSIPKIDPNDVIIFNASVDEDSIKKLIFVMVAEQAAGAKEIKIIMNSPGGIVQSGQKLVLVMENLGLPITVIADGSCSSMCFYILQAADHRQMTKRTTLMIHNELFTAPMKSVRELIPFLKSATNYQDAFWNFTVHRMKISKKEVKKRVAASDGQYTFNWEEALKIGAIDSVIEPLKSRGAIFITDD